MVSDAPLIPDRFDRRILSELQKDGSLSNLELADRVGLSPSPCSRRVKALEEAGVIEKRVTVLNRKKLGFSLTVLINIGMDRHTPERFERFEKEVNELPEVQECYMITGLQADYQLKVVVPDMDRYQEFLLNKITRIPGVTGVHSIFVMRRIVDRSELPLRYLDA